MTDNTTVDNYRLDSYTIKTTALTDDSKVQSINAVLPFISNMDVVSDSLTYTGYALKGTADSAASWFIMKSETVGTVTSVRFASAPFTMDKVWDDRASLSYD